MTVVSPYPHIVRETIRVPEHWYREHGHAAAMKLVEETDARAFATAERVGMKRTSVRGRLYWCDFQPLEEPMYLLGPGAPQITCFQDAFIHHPVAVYSITIDDQDYLDTLS